MKLSLKLLTLTLGLAITSQTFASYQPPCFDQYYSKVAGINQEIFELEQTSKYYNGHQGKIDEITRLLSEKIAIRDDLMMVSSWIGHTNLNDAITAQKYRMKMLEAIKDSPQIGLNTPGREIGQPKYPPLGLRSPETDYISVLLKPFIKSGAACANNRLMSADEFKEVLIDIVATESLEKGTEFPLNLRLEYTLRQTETTGNESVDTKKCADALLNSKVLKDKNFPRMHNLTVTSSQLVKGKIYNYLKYSLTDKQKQTYSGWMYLGKEGASCNTFLNWGAATRAIKVTRDSTREIIYQDDCAYDYKIDRSRDERCEKLEY